ncbi:MAG: nucleotide sugar dehydrogenase [Planctomycetes bacterium]|nr:nucleotide sugar dehydrogenase [Planctomycetota bacterium]
MRVCVQGLWHLGSVTATALASRGHSVIGLDADGEVVENLNQAVPPLFEPGLESLLSQGIASGKLSFTTDAETALSNAQVLWVAYDTPVDDDDKADTDFVIDKVKMALPQLPSGAVVLVSSQLPAGSVKQLETFARKLCPEKHLMFACSPENLRLGKALDVFLNPDRIIVGCRDQKTRAVLESLFAPIAAHIEWMQVESAEMTKHAINAFLALSVTFANEVASICEMVGADAKEVERGLKTEQRIGPKAYLSPGGAFSGGTLARDINFLSTAGKKYHLPTALVDSVKTSNDHHRTWARRKIIEICPGISRTRIAVWGLTYKPGTDTLRRSASVELINFLLQKGADIAVHDPVVRSLPDRWKGKVHLRREPLEAVKGADLLVIGTEWPEYRQLNPQEVKAVNPELVVVDAGRFLSSWTEHGLNCVSVGAPYKAEDMPDAI